MRKIARPSKKSCVHHVTRFSFNALRSAPMIGFSARKVSADQKGITHTFNSSFFSYEGNSVFVSNRAIARPRNYQRKMVGTRQGLKGEPVTVAMAEGGR